VAPYTCTSTFSGTMFVYTCANAASISAVVPTL